MFKRMITATILIILVLLGIFTLSDAAFAGISAILIMVGAWEWANLSGFKTLKGQFFYLAFTFILMWISVHISPVSILIVSLFWWIIVSVLLFSWSLERLKKINKYGLAVAGFFVLIPFWISLNTVHQQPSSRAWLLMVLILVWCIDSGAYFVGRYFGKQKLAPHISPNKTWEGLVGAFIAASLWVITALIIFPSTQEKYGALILLALITLFFSIIGDLAESAMKRIRNVKDSGQLLPGHGGVLDRIDSLTSAIPIFTLGAILLGIIV